MLSSQPAQFYSHGGLNMYDYFNNSNNVNYPTNSMTQGTPFSVKDILNLAEDGQHLCYETSFILEDEQYTCNSNVPQGSNNYTVPTPHQSECAQYYYGDQYECGVKPENQWEEATRSLLTNQQTGMTSSHVEQLSCLNPPFQNIESSHDNSKCEFIAMN